MAEFDDAERQDVLREFKAVVNMSQATLRKWLSSTESRSVGMTHGGDTVAAPGGQEAVGHEMGGRILDVLAKKHDALEDKDYAAMRKVIGYVHRHMKQRPHGDITDTRWRKSLINWGHDPLT